jgi:hypothetical protein
MKTRMNENYGLKNIIGAIEKQTEKLNSTLNVS